jgi:hypothetical protein
MLHLETVEPGTFSILKKLMQIPDTADFHLVGGTALSLMYGHRTSSRFGFLQMKSLTIPLSIKSSGNAFCI